MFLEPQNGTGQNRQDSTGCEKSVCLHHLRFHQTDTPERMTARGSMMTLTRKNTFMAEPVTRSLRSSGSTGRMEIRSSSDVSQFMTLSTRSRLAMGAERMKLDIQMELPTTTTRPAVAPVPTV